MSGQIIEFLRNSDDFISGEEISRLLGITRAGVWKRVKSLRQKGYLIEASPSKGYRLLYSPDILTENEIRAAVKGNIIGREVIFFESTTSTNDRAMEFGQKGYPEGVLVIADTQEKGKGRLGRTWFSPSGVNLYFSVLLRPTFSPKDAALLTLMAAVATVSGIKKNAGLDASIKWPNDILIRDKKVGGILTEMKSDMDRINFVVLGIGINVNLRLGSLHKNIRSIATSLKQETRKSINRTELLGQVLRELEYWYKALLRDRKEPLLDEWRAMSSTLGNKVSVRTKDRVISGIAEDIAKDGELIVRLPSGLIEKVYAGEVTIPKNQNAKFKTQN